MSVARRIVPLVLLAVCCLLLPPVQGLRLGPAAPARVSAAPPDQAGPPDVSPEVHHDVSPPLRGIPPLHEERGPQERPLRLLPPGRGTTQQDPVVQSSAGTLA